MRVLVRLTVILYITAAILIVAVQGLSLLAGDDQPLLFVAQSRKLLLKHSVQLADVNRGLRVSMMQSDLLARKSVWSPDHQKVAILSYRYNRNNPQENYEIYVADVDAQTIYNLSNHSTNDHSPSWSPDSTRIAYVSERDDNTEIYVADADGQNQRNLTNHPAPDREPQWSPDGTMIAFLSKRDGNQEIYMMDANGSNLRNLTNHPSHDHSPVWSPDSTRIAFTSQRDGNREIYVVNVHSQELRVLASSPGSAFNVVWQAD